MKESDKGTVKEAIFMVAQLVHHRPIKPNGLVDCTVTGRANGHTGVTWLYLCMGVKESETVCSMCQSGFYLPTWFDD